jgi:membrane protein DedA with SNARE-associated domain
MAYLGILVAAAIEGEVAYLAACALVAAGTLDPLLVVIAGTIGAAVGDQAYYFAFRGRLPRLMARFPSLERAAAPLLDLVARRQTFATMLVRFAPGFRVALTAACVSAGVSPWRFVVLNTLTSAVWAIGFLVVIGWGGPAALTRFGLGGWKGALVMGLVVLVLFRVVAKANAARAATPPT